MPDRGARKARGRAWGAGLLAWALPAQEPPPAYLQQLLDTPVLAASRAPLPLRQTPGVVTVLTREEILASGARSLLDLLRLIPGFDVGSDVQGQIGPSFRGIWAYEGKLLLLWDGLEMSELLYGEVQMGDRYPVDQIARIEVVRGPGSVTHGDSAEVAVVKVTTLGADELPALGGALTQGQGPRRPMHQSLQLVSGFRSGSLEWKAGGYLGVAQRGDRTYTDAQGSTYDMAGQSRIRPLFFHLGLTWGSFKAQGIVDQYALDHRDNLGVTLPTPSGIAFRSSSFKAQYTWNLPGNLTLTPSFTRLEHHPWWTETYLDVGFTQFSARRTQGALDLLWEASPAFKVAAGLVARTDTAQSESSANPFTFRDGARKVSYTNQAAYTELQYQGPVNLIAGARYERFSQAGETVVPRLALTRAWGPWHFKALTARSFHAPSIMNQNQVYAPGIEVVPERTRTSELEGGWTDGATLVTVNLFDIVLDRPIVFDQGPQDPNGGNGGYLNQGRLASRGLEVDARRRFERGFLNLALAFHRAVEAGETYGVPGDSSRFLGVADRKVSLLAGYRPAPAWTLSATALFLGPRQGFAWLPESRTFGLQAFPSRLLLGAQAAFTAGPFTASLGVQDALNQSQPYIQAYDGGHAPLPGPSREWVLKLRHGF